MDDTEEICAHVDQKGRFCNQCGARLTTAASKRESFRDHVDKKLADGDAK